MTTIDRLGRYLWAIAIVTFVFGDIVTTAVGLQVPGVIEGNSLPAVLLAEYGIESLLAVKLILVGAMFAVYIIIEDLYGSHPISDARVGIPLAAAGLGVYAIVNNIDVITTAL